MHTLELYMYLSATFNSYALHKLYHAVLTVLVLYHCTQQQDENVTTTTVTTTDITSSEAHSIMISIILALIMLIIEVLCLAGVVQICVYVNIKLANSNVSLCLQLYHTFTHAFLCLMQTEHF
jgi:Na+/H+ antiporter NhaC